MKDLGELCYFLGIKVIRSLDGIWFLQKQYGVDMPPKNGMAHCKPISIPLEQNVKLGLEKGERIDA